MSDTFRLVLGASLLIGSLGLVLRLTALGATQPARTGRPQLRAGPLKKSSSSFSASHPLTTLVPSSHTMFFTVPLLVPIQKEALQSFHKALAMESLPSGVGPAFHPQCWKHWKGVALTEWNVYLLYETTSGQRSPCLLLCFSALCFLISYWTMHVRSLK